MASTTPKRPPPNETNRRRYQFPDYPGHHAQHQEFIAQIRDLQASFEQGDRRFHYAGERVVIGWLIHHIGRSDRELAQYLRTHGYPGAAA